nr:phospholipase A2 inhibitor and Ly6/PLAUR domain-containing protein-like [Chrysemys picta bellii]
MMVSFILCLFPALLATTSAQGQPLTCNKCSGTANSCKDTKETCTVNTATRGCNSAAEENTLDGTKITLFSKGCLSDYNSGIKSPITFTVGKDKYVRINTEGCNNADKCNVNVLEVPTVDSTVKEVQCPTCFALNGEPCNTQTIPCTGNEDHCVDFVGILTKESADAPVSIFAAKGCGSASTTNIKPGTSLVSAVYTYKFTKATSNPAEKITPTTKPPTTTKPTPATTSGASPALGKFSFALYLPGLTGLLLVKLLS